MGPNTKGSNGRGITTYTTPKCNHKNKKGKKVNRKRKPMSFALADGLIPQQQYNQFQILRKLSQDPVATASPSSVTPRQLTRLSCPVSTPTRSPFRVSQTLQLKSS